MFPTPTLSLALAVALSAAAPASPTLLEQDNLAHTGIAARGARALEFSIALAPVPPGKLVDGEQEAWRYVIRAIDGKNECAKSRFKATCDVGTLATGERAAAMPVGPGGSGHMWTLYFAVRSTSGGVVGATISTATRCWSKLSRSAAGKALTPLPALADVDGDGSAELVVWSCAATAGRGLFPGGEAARHDEALFALVYRREGQEMHQDPAAAAGLLRKVASAYRSLDDPEWRRYPGNAWRSGVARALEACASEPGCTGAPAPEAEQPDQMSAELSAYCDLFKKLSLGPRDEKQRPLKVARALAAKGKPVSWLMRRWTEWLESSPTLGFAADEMAERVEFDCPELATWLRERPQ